MFVRGNRHSRADLVRIRYPGSPGFDQFAGHGFVCPGPQLNCGLCILRLLPDSLDERLPEQAAFRRAEEGGGCYIENEHDTSWYTDPDPTASC
jgi:hypothetical protein